tara:strand:+ start:1690 stop:2091 length:402 start_codon:yes stop_codon:yes gene_type:complete
MGLDPYEFKEGETGNPELGVLVDEREAEPLEPSNVDGVAGIDVVEEQWVLTVEDVDPHAGLTEEGGPGLEEVIGTKSPYGSHPLGDGDGPEDDEGEVVGHADVALSGILEASVQGLPRGRPSIGSNLIQVRLT